MVVKASHANLGSGAASWANGWEWRTPGGLEFHSSHRSEVSSGKGNAGDKGQGKNAVKAVGNGL